jgi:uncharacterized protein YcnI
MAEPEGWGILRQHFWGIVIQHLQVQECATKAERWIELPAEGQNPDDLESPAPGVTITAPVEGH